MTTTSNADTKQFVLSKNGRPTRRLVDGPRELNSRMWRMIKLMTEGHEDDPSGTKYSIDDASRAVGYRLRAGRELLKTPIFAGALREAEIAHFWRGPRKAIPTLAQLHPTVSPEVPPPTTDAPIPPPDAAATEAPTDVSPPSHHPLINGAVTAGYAIDLSDDA